VVAAGVVVTEVPRLIAAEEAGAAEARPVAAEAEVAEVGVGAEAAEVGTVVVEAVATDVVVADELEVAARPTDDVTVDSISVSSSSSSSMAGG